METFPSPYLPGFTGNKPANKIRPFKQIFIWVANQYDDM